MRRLEEQMQTMNSKLDSMEEAFESRRADDESKLGIKLPHG